MSSKYINIYNELSANIENGVFKVNDTIYSESELMNEYGVSRDTARKALNRLEQNGYIQKQKGKRAIVLDISTFDFPVSGVVSFKELASKLGSNSKTILEELDCIEPSKKISEKLELKPSEKVWKIVRTRSIEEEKIILDKDYLAQKYVNNITKNICEDSIYFLLCY